MENNMTLIDFGKKFVGELNVNQTEFKVTEISQRINKMIWTKDSRPLSFEDKAQIISSMRDGADNDRVRMLIEQVERNVK